MTQSAPWYRSLLLLVLSAVALPPVGLILLWIRPTTGVLRKLAGTLAIAALGIVHLVLFFGLRVEMDGTGRFPIFSFYHPEAHFEALERSREEHRIQPLDSPPLQPPEAAAVPVTDEPTGLAERDEPLETPAPDRDAVPESEPRVVQAYWTDYRGPERDGRYDEIEIRTDWPQAGPPLLWKQPIGGGYASFVAAEGRAFTIEQRRSQEVVAAYDVETGREIWIYGWDAEFRESMGGDGPRATPTWDEGRVYALGATGYLVCLEAARGRLLWSLNILEDNGAENLPWAMSASPLVVGEKLITLPGGPAGRSVVAYHKLTGEPIWRSLSDRQAYTSPMWVNLAGKEQLLVVSAERAMGLELEDGSVLWDYPWVTGYGVNSAQPLIVDENHFFISAGYGHGAALVEVSREGDGFRAQNVWQNINMKNKFNSSVLHDGHVYGLDEGILACLDVRTGARRWKAGRYGYGQLILGGDRIIVITESGDLVLVEATPAEHRELARFSALSGKTWNNPAMESGRLLVRNTTQMACFDLRLR